jgi:DNA-binding LytR/AlgR family response regulator
MITIETNSTKKNQGLKQRIITAPGIQAGALITPAIRRLPYRHPASNNNVLDASVLQPSGTAEDKNINIYVKVNSVLKQVKTKDIYLVEGLGDYLNIYTQEKRYTIYSTMYSILEKLPKTDFMRVHRSYIVRLDCISSIEKNKLVVELKKVPVSKTYKNEVLSKLNIV